MERLYIFTLAHALFRKTGIPPRLRWGKLFPGHALAAADALEHALHVADRRLRQDAMPEIEDKRHARKSRQHVIDRAVERRSSGQQYQWIKISLDGMALADPIPHHQTVHGPIKPYPVDRNLLDIRPQQGSHAAGKTDNLCTRHLGANLGNDAAGGLDTPANEILR